MKELHEIGETLIKKYNMAIKSGSKHQLNSWAVSSKPLYGQQYYVNNICYSGLGSCISEREDYVISMLHPARYEDVNYDWGVRDAFRPTKNQMTEYLHWLVYESPWKNAFAEVRTAEEMDLQGYVFLKTDIPSNSLLGALTALRQPWEYSNLVQTFLMLRNTLKDGKSPKVSALCFYLAHVVEYLPDKEQFVRGQLQSNHLPLNAGSMGITDIKNFISSNMVLPNRSAKEINHCNGVTKLWGYSNISYYPVLIEEIEKYVVGEVQSKIKRIFSTDVRFFYDPHKVHKKVMSKEGTIAIFNKLIEGIV